MDPFEQARIRVEGRLRDRYRQDRDQALGSNALVETVSQPSHVVNIEDPVKAAQGRIEERLTARYRQDRQQALDSINSH